MNPELIKIIIFGLSFFIIGNYGIHYFFKQKRKKVFDQLKELKFELINNVPTYIEGKNKLSYSFQIMRSDILLYDKNLVVFPYNHHFKGIIKQYQPILHYSFEDQLKKLNGVSKSIRIESIRAENKKIWINEVLTNHILKAKIGIEIDLNEKEIDLDKIIKENNYVVQQRL